MITDETHNSKSTELDTRPPVVCSNMSDCFAVGVCFAKHEVMFADKIAIAVRLCHLVGDSR